MRKDSNHTRGRCGRSTLARHVVTALAGASIVMSQAMLVTCVPNVAYADEVASDTASDERLNELWDGVLSAMDAEAEARSKLNVSQEEAAQISESMSETKASLDSMKVEKQELTDSLTALVEFANNPSEGNKAYTDAVVGVVDALEAMTDAEKTLDTAKSEYATARQRLADLNAELSKSDDGAAIEEAKAKLSEAEATLRQRTEAKDDAEAQLSDANTRLTQGLASVNGDSKKAFDQAQRDVDAKQVALDEATDQKARLDETVASDKKSLAEQGSEPVTYSMSDLGTPGAYMDGIDISSYEDGIDLSAIPVDFVIVKASEGSNPEGEWYRCKHESKVDQSLALGKCTGLYHFYTTNATPEEQAKMFVESASAYVGKVAFFLDWESRTYDGGRGTSPVATLDPSVAKAWLDAVYEMTGVKPGIYMSRSVTTMHDWSEVAAEYPLWVAAYPNSDFVEGYNQSYKDTYGGNVGAWKEPLIWQYSSTTVLSGWGRRLDVNVMYGTKDDWAKLVGQNWESKLKSDEELLAKAVTAETDAQRAYDDARKRLDEASAGIKGQSAELEGTFALVSEKEGALATAKADFDAATQRKNECEEALAGLEGRNADLTKDIAEAEKALKDASTTIQESKEAVKKAQSEFSMVQHKKDMLKRVFELTSTMGDAGSSDGEKATESETDATEVEGDDAAAKSAPGILSVTAEPVVKGVTVLFGGVSGALSPTVAEAAPKSSSEPQGATQNALTSKELPSAQAIIQNPGVLDEFIGAAGDDSVRELLEDIKADAQRINEIGAETARQTQSYDEMKASLAALNERIPDEERAVATAQANLDSAREAYMAENPDGTAEAPAGYEDKKRTPQTGLGSGGAGDRSLVTLWVDMFALAVVVTVVFVFIQEKRGERREGRRPRRG